MFFKIALNMIAGCFDTSCRAPAGSDQLVLGVILIKRETTRPRLDVWLGGRSSISNEWAEGVVGYLKTEFPKAEVFRYKPHYGGGNGAKR
jgi:hypothetical protein